MAIIEESFSVECDDRISQLPDDVLCLILSLLSFRERARMRLLCSRWKVLSQFTFDLRLNLLSIFGIYINSFSFNDMKEMLRHKSKFLTAVTQILKLYTGRKLDTFEVSFPLEDDSASNVDQWISSALEHGVNRLKIDFGPPPMGTESYYTFPFHLLPDGKTSPLKHLSLKFCEVFVVPGNAIKFNSLVTLYIGHARINQVSLDSILSGCVNLEFLRIKMCIVPKICCITGALGRLKRLIMEYCLHRGHIELNSLPELTTFEYMGGVKKFTLRSLPSLEKMYFRFENLSSEGMHSVFINKLAEDVSHLQTLSLFLVPFELYF
ncbi:unnamed protein product [Cuscuta europaea]|uniref:F-box domain-containing protein n=1 Tax=Cuscuta europaea TaxID=41803 RepID=A0A9P0ZKT7_CUSEU|nr:unnamed protein product [Cuscuta europaea]